MAFGIVAAVVPHVPSRGGTRLRPARRASVVRAIVSPAFQARFAIGVFVTVPVPFRDVRAAAVGSFTPGFATAITDVDIEAEVHAPFGLLDDVLPALQRVRERSLVIGLW